MLKWPPSIVSPGLGTFGTFRIMSVLELPTTTMEFLLGRAMGVRTWT
jgi:hypothetical protein